MDNSVSGNLVLKLLVLLFDFQFTLFYFTLLMGAGFKKSEHLSSSKILFLFLGFLGNSHFSCSET